MYGTAGVWGYKSTADISVTDVGNRRNRMLAGCARGKLQIPPGKQTTEKGGLMFFVLLRAILRLFGSSWSDREERRYSAGRFDELLRPQVRWGFVAVGVLFVYPPAVGVTAAIVMLI